LPSVLLLLSDVSLSFSLSISLGRKIDLEDPELSQANSLLFLLRNSDENGPGGPGALASKFLIVFTKKL